MRRAAVVLFAGLALVYAGVCAIMFFRQASYVYFPERAYDATPETVGLPYEPVRLRATDGVDLSAWWIPAQASRGALVFAHGNGGNMSHRLDKAAHLRSLGLSVLLFDYRGYGGSGGAPTEEGTYADMDAALDHVVRRRDAAPPRVVLYGESLGGAVAVEAATRHACAAVVVESTFTSLRAMARHYYPLVPSGLLRLRYDSAGRIGAVRCPVLVLHSREDDIVPYAMGRALFAAAREPKRFADLRGSHNGGGLMASPEAQSALAAFLDEVLGDER